MMGVQIVSVAESAKGSETESVGRGASGWDGECEGSVSGLGGLGFRDLLQQGLFEALLVLLARHLHHHLVYHLRYGFGFGVYTGFYLEKQVSRV